MARQPKPRPRDAAQQASSELSEQVLIALRRITRSIDLHSRLLVQQHGVTVPQLLLLQELACSGAMTVGDLTRRLNLGQPTVSGILERLVKRHLVQRQRSQADRRQVLVQLTAAGRQLLRSAPPPLQDQFLQRFARLQPWEQTLILSCVQRIVSMMNADNLDANALLATGPADVTESQVGRLLAVKPAPEAETDP